MKIVTKNAEAHLFEQVELLNNQAREGWQCIYFKVPEKPTHNSSMGLTFDIRHVGELLEKSKGNIYLCNNGDVFIIFRGMLKPIHVKLARYFWCLDASHVNWQPGHNLFTIIDFIKEWDSFYSRCETLYLWNLVASEIRSFNVTPSEGSSVSA